MTRNVTAETSFCDATRYLSELGAADQTFRNSLVVAHNKGLGLTL